MLQITDKKGFTLIELIVAVAIFGALSVVSVQTLWTTLSTRSKQYSIENSSSAIRPIVSTLSQAISEASTIQIPDATHIVITGTPDRTIRLNGMVLEQSISSGPYVSLTPVNVLVSTFVLSPVGSAPKVVAVTLGGTYADSLGSHAFSYNFSVTPRVAL